VETIDVGLGPSRARTAVVAIVLIAVWNIPTADPTWWSDALLGVLAAASLFLLVPFTGTPYVVNVVSVVARRPVALTARARAMVRLPPEFDARRFVAHCYLVVVALQVTLVAVRFLNGS
jgi:hypothetical protein